MPKLHQMREQQEQQQVPQKQEQQVPEPVQQREPVRAQALLPSCHKQTELRRQR